MITQLTLPASEPVSLVMMKQYLRVDVVDDDTLIQSLISAARRTAEHLTGRIIAEREVRIDLSGFAGGVLPCSPISEVSSVKYLDSSKELQTLAGIDFCPHPLSPQIFAPDSGWPSVAHSWQAVQISCTAGMNPVPEDIQSWLMLRVATAYENRDVVLDQKSGLLPRDHVDGLLDPYRLVVV